MSSRAPAWFETKYVEGVTHALQHKGFVLKPAVSPPDNINGLTVNWRVAAAGEATQKSQAIENVNVMNLGRQLVTATMIDWEANDYIQNTDLNKMSVTEQDKVQQSGAMAIGRRFDRIIIGAMDAATTAIPTVGTGAAAISVTDLLTAQNQIFDEGGSGYEYYAAVPSFFMSQLELFREFASADYVGPEYPLLKALGARRYRGITIIPLPASLTNADKRFFNVPAANQMDGYIWCSHAIGFAQAQAPTSRIDYVPEKKSWLAANDMTACAAVILPEGIRRLRFASNAALTRPSP
jgi:hypothetical protein